MKKTKKHYSKNLNRTLKMMSKSTTLLKKKIKKKKRNENKKKKNIKPGERSIEKKRKKNTGNIKRKLISIKRLRNRK
jgi:hypothetical protein